MKEYKETNIAWIGKIPLNWKLKKIKRVFKTINGYGFPEDLQGRKSGDIPFFKVSDFPKRSNFIDSSLNYVSNEIINRKNWKIIDPMSILTAKIGEAMNKNHRKINTTECLIDNNMMALIIKEGFLKYNFYLMTLLDFRWFANPGAVPSLNNRQFRESSIVSPPLIEQKKIAKFLDQKTTEIDSLITEKEKLIKLLEEKRQAVITETVTNGLDPNEKMKDSGVEWLGRIPEHWELNRLGTITDKLSNGYVGPTRDILRDNGNRYLQSLHIKNGKILFNKKPYYVDESWSNEKEKSKLMKGDLVIVQTGDIGQCAVITSEFDGANCHALIIARLKSHVGFGEYLNWYFQSNFGFFSLLSFKTGALHPHLDPGRIKNMKILLPSKQEQLEIISYLNKEVNNIESLINMQRGIIDKLKEYRESLIYEAVTGKIDVQEMMNESEQEEVSSS